MKISLFSTCMNRTEHLKQTLLKNLEDNSNYDNFEYLILNYNSKDDLEEWILDNFTEYINKGRLVYYREKTSRYYSFAHADNIAARLCTGDIICNVMADTFTGEGFSSYVNKTLTDRPASFIRCTEPGGAAGRICMRREHFLELGGYDEALEGWGGQDANLVFRAIAYGIELIPMEKKYYSFMRNPEELKLQYLKVKKNNLLNNLRTTTEKIAKRDIIANRDSGFGIAKVYQNFREDEPIVLDQKAWKPKWQFLLCRFINSLLIGKNH